MKTGHCLTGQYLHWTKGQPTPQCWWPILDPGALIQRVPRVEAPAEDPVGGGAEGDWEGEEPVEEPGAPCRCEAQPGGTRLPLYYGCGKTGSG